MWIFDIVGKIEIGWKELSGMGTVELLIQKQCDI